MDTPIEEVPNSVIRNPHETLVFDTLYDGRLIKCEAQLLPGDHEDYAVKALIGNRWYRANLNSCADLPGLWVIGEQQIACWDTAPHFNGLLKFDVSPNVVIKIPVAALFEYFISQCCIQYARMEAMSTRRYSSDPRLHPHN